MNPKPKDSRYPKARKVAQDIAYASGVAIKVAGVVATVAKSSEYATKAITKTCDYLDRRAERAEREDRAERAVGTVGAFGSNARR